LNRKPAYCDRIIYKGSIICEEYTSVVGGGSDHHAVYGVFRVQGNGDEDSSKGSADMSVVIWNRNVRLFRGFVVPLMVLIIVVGIMWSFVCWWN